MIKPIAISLSPNTEKDDVFLALKTLFKPISWYDFRITEKLEEKFTALFGKGYYSLAVNSGRSAEYLILKSLDVGLGDEVIVQGFTCVAVPNSVLWLGAKPVYADVGNGFNMDADSAKERLTKNTKAIILQHSFGIPANVKKIKKIFKNKKIFVIEDCALSLGAEYEGKKVGTLGDAAFFSFGRDKVLSSVFGGMILTKNKNLYTRLKAERQNLAYPSPVWLLQQILHPIFFAFILPLYNVGSGKFTIGKVLLVSLQKLNLLSRAIYPEEMRGRKTKHFPKKMPGALAKLAIHQLDKLGRFNNHRNKLASFYFKSFKNSKITLPPQVKGSIWMRFPVLSFKSEKIYRWARKNGVLLGDWYKSPVVPVTHLDAVGYKPLSCTNAEKFSRIIVNLPTYPTMTLKDAQRVVNLIKQCINTK